MTDAILSRWAERAAAAERNRAAMPVVSAWVAELRQHFPDCRVRYAAEAGRVQGAPGPEGVIATVAFVPKGMK
jgi:hypothetical protein